MAIKASLKKGGIQPDAGSPQPNPGTGTDILVSWSSPGLLGPVRNITRDCKNSHGSRTPDEATCRWQGPSLPLA
ncbi:hypothetical protein PGT21_011184 [Puccinia graminis f. sp. tritici]|uniref:Uncharacterized protein n=1 Tax=Puccinia graminis f. sp. tritici TaxID=56615 RepID=A0A5B0PG32_PUCGR|nr:hypothetical protein PGT21_011184 [Puccinia graminis f. sp. tritici]